MPCEKCGREWDSHDWFTPIEWEPDPSTDGPRYPKGATRWLMKGHEPLPEPQCWPNKKETVPA